MVCSNLFFMVIEEIEPDERFAAAWKCITEWAPPYRLKIIKYLMGFLHTVAKHSESNKMSADNLAIVFGPCLLWPEHQSLEDAMDIPYVYLYLRFDPFFE